MLRGFRAVAGSARTDLVGQKQKRSSPPPKKQSRPMHRFLRTPTAQSARHHSCRQIAQSTFGRFSELFRMPARKGARTRCGLRHVRGEDGHAFRHDDLPGTAAILPHAHQRPCIEIGSTAVLYPASSETEPRGNLKSDNPERRSNQMELATPINLCTLENEPAPRQRKLSQPIARGTV